ncbi:MAG: WYL domain-containing protein [Firmicutes bacterium]|nr:WYL domain-containing protein [Bacillota bacterium]
MRKISKNYKIGKMIEYLKVHDIVSREELALYLCSNKKTISGYVGDINSSGMYFIDSISGPNGGYRLNKKNLGKELYFDASEINSLMIANKIIREECSEIYPEFDSLCAKIGKFNYLNDSLEESIIIKSFKSISDDYETRKKQEKIDTAIINQCKIYIYEYKRINKRERESEKRVIHPYAVINYRSSLYLVGFCELRKDLRFFKLDRLKKFKVSEEKFVKDIDYTNEDLLKSCIGIHRGKSFELKLIVRFPFDEIISEKIWTDDQVINRLDDDSIEFIGTMEGEEEIITWLLSMKDKVDIISPKYIKDEYGKVLGNILENYNKTRNR